MFIDFLYHCLIIQLSGDETMPRERNISKREIKDPQIRKQEILDTAMTLFTYQGYEQTSMRDIAKEINVSLGLCYRYFDSKQALSTNIITSFINQKTKIYMMNFLCVFVSISLLLY